MCRTLSLVALSLMLFAGADWRQFRGPNGAGVSEDTGLPVTWSATENVVWKTALPGFGASSPITLGDKIFLTAYSGYGLDRRDPGEPADLMLHVLCVDRATGKILWDKTSKPKPPETDYVKYVYDHGYASGTPVTDGESIFVFFGRSGVCAYSLDGELLWCSSVGTKIHRLNWGTGSSPILAGDLLIVNASIESESLVALNKKTGEEVWRAGEIKDSWTTPVLVDLPGGKQEVVVSSHSQVRGYDPATGKQLWECAGIEDYVVPSPIAHDGIVYVTGGRSRDSATLAIRAGGRGDVTDTHLLWELEKTPKIPTPVYHNGLLYWLSYEGFVYCVKADSGEVVYRDRLSGNLKVYASPVLADGKLYTVSRTKGAVVLAAGEKLEELARNDLGDGSVFNATPVVSNGQLLLRSDKFLYCIGK